jgi:adenine-specific DNA glycosylase
VGKKPQDPRKVVRKLMKAGKVKKKCCRSKPRCKKCPVLALKKAKQDLAA